MCGFKTVLSVDVIWSVLTANRKRRQLRDLIQAKPGTDKQHTIPHWPDSSYLVKIRWVGLQFQVAWCELKKKLVSHVKKKRRFSNSTAEVERLAFKWGSSVNILENNIYVVQFHDLLVLKDCGLRKFSRKAAVVRQKDLQSKQWSTISNFCSV